MKIAALSKNNIYRISENVKIVKGKYKGQQGVIVAYIDIENRNYSTHYWVHVFGYKAEIISYKHLEKFSE